MTFKLFLKDKELDSFNVPLKYRKYYSGQDAAPFSMVFIGGNHEASDYLWTEMIFVKT